MAKRPRRSGGNSASAATRCTIIVCRGCCCGTKDFPGLNHAAQYTGLKRALEPSASVRASDCLDACEQANVIVVRPSVAGRTAGGRPVWLTMANDHDIEADIIGWVEAGGPGLAEMPPVLDLYEYRPSRRLQSNLD